MYRKEATNGRRRGKMPKIMYNQSMSKQKQSSKKQTPPPRKKQSNSYNVRFVYIILPIITSIVNPFHNVIQGRLRLLL